MVPLTYGRNQVLAERAVEIESGIETPVATGGGVVDGSRPRIDDPLPLRVHLVLNRRVGERGDDHVEVDAVDGLPARPVVAPAGMLAMTVPIVVIPVTDTT